MSLGSLGGGPPPGRSGGTGPSAPATRPPWLLVLSSLTLVYGGLMLVSGLTALRNPAAAAKFPMTRPLPPAEDALTRELMTVSGEIVARHAGAIRARAAASMVVALFMLYSAAAALSLDRHGRTATLLAAWMGIAYQVGTLPLVIPIASDYAHSSAPILIRMVAAEGAGAGNANADKAGGTTAAPAPGAPAGGDKGADEPATQAEALAGFTRTVFLGVPIATALLGILGSALLIAYFGGQRGRLLYGLPPRR